MARTISAASLAKLATDYGTKPVNIIEIIWTEGGPRDAYADKDIAGGIKGKILELGGLDEVLQISNGASSAEVTIILNDTDGTIKNILDNNDIHKRPCYIYQWFEGISTSEKFLIFQGQISSPISWKESDRTVEFNVISKLEDKEIGFSPEEGEFAQIPKNLVGVPWPMAFGTVLDIPAVQIAETTNGVLAQGTGIHDFTIQDQVNALSAQKSYLTEIGILWVVSGGFLKSIGNEDGGQQAIDHGNQLLAQAGDLGLQILELNEALLEQKSWEIAQVRIINGSSFPQGVAVTLSVNDALFTGSFAGDIFNIDSRIHPEFGEFCGTSSIDTGTGIVISQSTGTGCRERPHITGSLFGRQENGDPIFIVGDSIEGDSAGFFWAEAGSRVTIAGNEPIQFVVSIVPGTVLRVMAKRTFEGTKRLIVVPSDRYTVSNVSYGSVSAVVVTVNKPLSTYSDEGWEDQIYVTFQSSVGPNTVDVISYLLGTYAPHLDIDSTSFTSVRARLENYPSHFALFDRRNIVEVLAEIAFQARCAIWIANDTVYLRYLPESPTAITDISEDDVRSQTMEVFTTDTEDLVTKMVGTWKESYAAEEPNKVILRHNVKKYGTIEETFDFYIYNNQQLVIKSMTFWLIRKSNTWKKVRFTTPLHKLQVEAMDAVNLNFSGTYVASSAIKGIAERATYDSDRRTIDFEFWTPVKAGTMVPYDFAWPADISQSLIFPTIEEEEAGFAGGDGPGKNSRGTIVQSGGTITYDDYCEGSRDQQGVCRRDYGDRKPSDVGDVKPTPLFPQVDTGPEGGNPGVNTPQYEQNPINTGPALTYIDIRTTNIYDSTTKKSCKLDTFFKRIQDGDLQMRTDAKLANDENTGEFVFEWDEDKFAAGRAFLKD